MTAEFVINDEASDVQLARLVRFIHAAKKPLMIHVARFVKSRTLQQNKALFGHAYKILRDETGHEMDELHDFFCKRFFGVHEYEVFGDVRKRPLRTTTTNEQGKRDVLPWDRFSEFFASVQQFAASELTIHIPDPNPDWWRQKDAA